MAWISLHYARVKEYRKIPLIHPGRIYGQRTYLMGLHSGRRGLIFGRKNTSNCNLLNIIFFFQYKTRILIFFTSCKMWNMLKVNNKDTRIRKVDDKVKNTDTVDVVLCLFIVNFEHISFLVIVLLLLTLTSSLLSGVVVRCCCSLFWRFVHAGNKLGKVSTYGETR